MVRFGLNYERRVYLCVMQCLRYSVCTVCSRSPSLKKAVYNLALAQLGGRACPPCNDRYMKERVTGWGDNAWARDRSRGLYIRGREGNE